ncbi:glutamate racemase [Candidatus Sumerlaeota bacterium]|nr:glutamate racemase [Candidatus Sumerlaeota bacterium]
MSENLEESRLLSDVSSSSTSADRRAIGIFDSGLGGMTVARAVRRAFPAEPICYLGDTARVPYGTKSPATVRRYAREIVAFLREQSVKIIVAACNTVSAAALPDLDGAYDVPLIGVVEMGAEAAVGPDEKTRAESPKPRRIGVIGTETTIASGAYVRAIQRRAPEAEVIQKACPLLVPLIEEGWNRHRVTNLVIEEYLAPMRNEGIDTLILGCTHYPLIRPALGEFFGREVRLVDSAEAIVQALRAAFDSGTLGRAAAGAVSPAGEPARGEARYFVTDRSNRFRELVAAFMGESDLTVEQISSDVLTEALTRAERPSTDDARSS